MSHKIKISQLPEAKDLKGFFTVGTRYESEEKKRSVKMSLEFLQINEEERIRNENVRKQEEEKRATAETTRQQNETARAEAEGDRKAAELLRQGAENQRLANESARAKAETERVQSENLRIESESDREAAEKSRTEAEVKRETAEKERERKLKESLDNFSVDTRQALNNFGSDAQSALEKFALEKNEALQGVKDATDALEELNANPPIIHGGTWWIYALDSGSYINTGVVAVGRSPYIDSETLNWMVWDEESQEYVDSGVSAFPFNVPDEDFVDNLMKEWDEEATDESEAEAEP